MIIPADPGKYEYPALKGCQMSCFPLTQNTSSDRTRDSVGVPTLPATVYLPGVRQTVLLCPCPCTGEYILIRGLYTGRGGTQIRPIFTVPTHRSCLTGDVGLSLCKRAPGTALLLRCLIPIPRFWTPYYPHCDCLLATWWSSKGQRPCHRARGS